MPLFTPLEITKSQVAVYKSVQWDCSYVFTACMETNTDYVRVSEFTDVSFTPRAEEEIVLAIVANLDKEADKIREEAIEKLNKIAAQKAEVLQITYIPSEEL
jgi:predicted TIM-barrel enzyme